MRDIVAEAEFHLGLRDRPPPDQGAPREPAPTSRPPDVPASPARVFNPLDVLAAARSGVDLYETPMNDDSLAPTLAIDDRSADEFYSLALAYENGTGVPRDQARAVAWYRKAANLGEARAQYKLGTLYQQGLGVERDYERAAEWFRRAYETLSRRAGRA